MSAYNYMVNDIEGANATLVAMPKTKQIAQNIDTKRAATNCKIALPLNSLSVIVKTTNI